MQATRGRVKDKSVNQQARKKSRFLSWRYILLFIYLGLLLASYIQRWSYPPEDRTLSAIQSRVLVPEVDGDHILNHKIELVYADYPADKTAPTAVGKVEEDFPVVLVHGSPGDGDILSGLAKLMRGK